MVRPSRVPHVPSEDSAPDGVAGDPGDPGEPARPGRPRSVEADQAILDAVIALLAESGYGGITMEGVAARAGVGKATLYRRWSSKPDLVLDAIRVMKAHTQHPDTGDTRADLVELVRGVIQWVGDQNLAQVVTGLIAELQRNPDLATLFRSQLLAPRRNETEEVLRRGIARGDIRPDVDLSLVLDQIIGTVFYRLLIAGEPVRPGLAEHLADQVLTGIAPTP
ncbi:MAG TPA: TetR/AcrR family transcriptional regulator [Acidimicrobiales bacterium]